MKICPQCQTTYTDDTLQYCLQDGASLNFTTAASALTRTSDWSDSETLVSASVPTAITPDKIRVDVPQQAEPVAPQMPETVNRTITHQTSVVEAPEKSNTALTVALTALATLLVIGAGIAAALYISRGGGNKTEVVQTTNSKANVVVSNVSNANQIANENKPANVNLAANMTPTATPTPKPTLKPKEVENIKSEVGNVIGNWTDASENHDLDAHLSNYADTVDYYKAGKVSAGRVREDKQNAFEAYNNINFNIDNMKITPDETGEKATAVFDKEWTFEGDEKNSSGKVQQQLQLAKIGGKWRITGEKDLKVYYTSK